jgi:outer membrane protein insertion porin family/translocation and assembly module TamA
VRPPAHALCGLFFGVLLAGPAPLRSQGLADREITEITFEGNEAFPQKELRRAILTDQTRCKSFLFKFPFPFCPLTDWGFAHSREFLDEGELPLDVVRLELYYRQRGFREARVDTVVTRTDDKAQVVFEVRENSPTLISRVDVQVRGDAIDSATVVSSLPIGVGDRLDLVALQQGEAAIADELRREGYIDAAVLRDYFIPRDSLTASVTLRVDPGPRVRVGEVEIEGSADVGDEVVRSLLDFQTGDWFRESRVIESQRRLFNLEAFRYANITSARASDSVVDLSVQVATAPRRAVRTGFGVQTDECVELQAQLINRNFFGGGRTMRVTGRVSNLLAKQLDGTFPCNGTSDEPVYQELNWLLDFSFLQPVLSDSRNSFQTRVFTERETVPDLYVRTSVGGELAFNLLLAPRMSLRPSYRPELTSFGGQSADIYFCVNFGLCTPDDIALLTESNWLSPLGLLWALNRTDSPLWTTSGYYVAADGEMAAAFTGSDYRYLRASLETAGFRPVFGDAVLAMRLRFGGVQGVSSSVFGGEEEGVEIIHPTKRFFAGGPQSVRGFGLNLLGPTVLVISDLEDCGSAELTPEELQACANDLEPNDFDERPVGGNALFEGSAELRLPVSERLTVVGFIDAGQVWQGVDDDVRLVATPGIGIRFNSPVGPLRMDLGYNTTGTKSKPVVAVRAETGEIVELEDEVAYDPFTWDEPSVLTEVWRRIQLQFSIGEAF